MTAVRKKQPEQLKAANDPTAPNAEELATLAAETDLKQLAKLPLFDIAEASVGEFIGTPPPPRRWLFQNVLPLGIVGLLVAPGGTGKSNLAIQMGIAVASGGRFADSWEVGESGGVLLLMAEDDRDELHRRTFNAAEHLGLTGEQLKPLFARSLIGEDIRLVSYSRERGIERTPTLERLIVTAKQIDNLKLIVIDPVSRWRDGDENDAGDTTKFVQAVERLAQETRATVLLIHHSSKNAGQSGESTQSAARGSSALVDGARWMAQLATVNKTLNKELKLLPEQMKMHAVLSVPKANYAPPQPEILLKRLEGGYLTQTAMPAKVKDLSRKDEQIIALLKTEAKEGRKYSTRSFCAAFAGVSKPLGLSDHALRARIVWLVEVGKIIKEGHTLNA